jgi:hypothetical protein
MGGLANHGDVSRQGPGRTLRKGYVCLLRQADVVVRVVADERDAVSIKGWESDRAS